MCVPACIWVCESGVYLCRNCRRESPVKYSRGEIPGIYVGGKRCTVSVMTKYAAGQAFMVYKVNTAFKEPTPELLRGKKVSFLLIRGKMG